MQESYEHFAYYEAHLSLFLITVILKLTETK